MDVPEVPEVPRARDGRLIVRAVGDETVVYDLETHRAHCLNQVARFVLDRCDGRTTAGEMARAVENRYAGIGPEAAAVAVQEALELLGRADLIEGLSVRAAGASYRRRSRRAAIQALGLASLAPLVLSLTAPTPAEAQTCVPRDRPCTSSRQCCPAAPCCRPQGQSAPTCRPGAGQCLP